MKKDYFEGLLPLAESNLLKKENGKLREIFAEVISDLRRDAILYIESDGPILHKECRASVADFIENKLKEHGIEVSIESKLLEW